MAVEKSLLNNSQDPLVSNKIVSLKSASSSTSIDEVSDMESSALVEMLHLEPESIVIEEDFSVPITEFDSIAQKKKTY